MSAVPDPSFGSKNGTLGGVGAIPVSGEAYDEDDAVEPLVTCCVSPTARTRESKSDIESDVSWA